MDDTITKTDDESTKKDDETTETDDASTGTEESVYAPDGGWGWMVTVAGFFVAFIEDGIVTSYGLLLPELLDAFGASVSLTSLPPGIMVATFLISGPVTAYLVRKWGCRPVGFCGGLLAALGVAASAYAPNIYLFLLGFGLVAGVGVGLIYLPSVTMVNLYFHKKRGMVAGIITSGSGFGLLALAPLTEMLMEQYGWRGCYLIMAAITLHFCVCASLMRPLHRPPPSSAHTSDIVDGVGVKAEDGLVNVQEMDGTVGCHQPSAITQLDRDGQGVNTHPGETGHVSPLLHTVHQEENAEFSCTAHKTHHVSLFSSVKNLFLGHHVMSGSHVHMSSDSSAGPRQVPLIRSRSHGHLDSRPSHHPHTRLPVNVLSTWLACQVPPSLSRHTLHSHQSSDNMARQHEGSEHQKGKSADSHLLDPGRKRPRHHSDSRVEWGHSLPSVHVADDILKHVLDKNHFKSSGPCPLHDQVPAENVHHDQQPSYVQIQPGSPSREEDSAPTTSSGSKARAVRWMRGHLVFALFLLGAFLIQLICYVPPLLTPSYAYQHGVSKEQVATILSIYGLLNTAGRLLAGLLVYCGVRTLYVHNLGTLLSAVACFIFPFSTSFPSIAVCLGLHGFFLGAFPPLQSVLLVEYLGLDRLASTFGTMCLVKAFACMAGAPLAGLLYTVTGTYAVPLGVCGGVLVLAALCHQLMDCCP